MAKKNDAAAAPKAAPLKVVKAAPAGAATEFSLPADVAAKYVLTEIHAGPVILPKAYGGERVDLRIISLAKADELYKMRWPHFRLK